MSGRLLVSLFVLLSASPARAEPQVWQEQSPTAPPAPPAPAAPPAAASAAPTPAAPGASPVTFRGPSLYRVLVGRQFCAAPCVLDLPPGPTRLVLVGESGSRSGVQALEAEETVVLPAGPSTVVVNLGARQRRTVGLTFLVLGGAMAVVGATTLGITAAVADRDTGFGARFANITGGVLLGLGVVYAAVGGGLYGSGKAPIAEVRSDAPSAAMPRLRGIGLAPLAGGGVAAGATFSF